MLKNGVILGVSGFLGTLHKLRGCAQHACLSHLSAGTVATAPVILGTAGAANGLKTIIENPCFCIASNICNSFAPTMLRASGARPGKVQAERIRGNHAL